LGKGEQQCRAAHLAWWFGMVDPRLQLVVQILGDSLPPSLH
jgi:hypothetical protein